MAVSWHWVCLEDDDLRMIEDGPQPAEGDDPEDCTEQDLWDWVLAVQEAVIESLESA